MKVDLYRVARLAAATTRRSQCGHISFNGIRCAHQGHGVIVEDKGQQTHVDLGTNTPVVVNGRRQIRRQVVRNPVVRCTAAPVRIGRLVPRTNSAVREPFQLEVRMGDRIARGVVALVIYV